MRSVIIGIIGGLIGVLVIAWIAKRAGKTTGQGGTP
jgi:hypothetical protein